MSCTCASVRALPATGRVVSGYKAILFDPDECLLVIHYYIHLNPVRVGALKAAETEEGALDKALLLKRRQVLRDYEWSSYRDYAGLRRPFRWLKVEAVVSRKDLSAVGERKPRWLR